MRDAVPKRAKSKIMPNAKGDANGRGGGIGMGGGVPSGIMMVSGPVLGGVVTGAIGGTKGIGMTGGIIFVFGSSKIGTSGSKLISFRSRTSGPR
jgi:hypothetical protein